MGSIPVRQEGVQNALFRFKSLTGKGIRQQAHDREFDPEVRMVAKARSAKNEGAAS